jgi:hypothetical protein
MYFEKFPQFVYDFDIAGKRKAIILTDITRNVRFRKEIFGNIELFDEYDIQDGDTPEIIADKVYGNSEYHWIIMLVNERFDYIADFPLSYDALLKYVDDKYGVGNANQIHHYENANGFIVNYDAQGAGAITNLQHEERVNESKRRIKLVSPNLIARVLKQFNDLI